MGVMCGWVNFTESIKWGDHNKMLLGVTKNQNWNMTHFLEYTWKNI
jgi:hypothetical protein